MIRMLNPVDAEELHRLRLICLKHDPQAFLSTYEFESAFPHSFYVQKLTPYQPHPFGFYGLFSQESLVAYVQLSQEYLPKNHHLANLFELSVHPDHRRHHFATKLCLYVKNQLITNTQIEQIHLKLISSNFIAYQLYLSLGFTHIATRPRAIKDDAGKYYDEYFMCLELPHPKKSSLLVIKPSQNSSR